MASGRYRLAAVLAVLIVAITIAVGWQGLRSPQTPAARAEAAPTPETQGPGPAGPESQATEPPVAEQETRPLTARTSTPAPASPSPSPTQPVLSAAARASCPAAATACVDLEDHFTWLQAGGHITYGPVAMEPGAPGTPDATPRGTFHVTWKAGPNYISNEYKEPMPWAVFFINGVAFHGGSLTKHSHGCVHLDIGSARYYHDHLPIGAEVAVF